AAVEAVWSEVPSATASGATPARLCDGELVVSVPSGAHAARARRDAAAMLRELAAVVEGPPTRLRVTVRR
ncbi:MAG TPA: DciA family protein, partial [Acidimicrobiales bacterium]|nr:DciA family protein [Acidimicrobiales bacterium]